MFCSVPFALAGDRKVRLIDLALSRVTQVNVKVR